MLHVEQTLRLPPLVGVGSFDLGRPWSVSTGDSKCSAENCKLLMCKGLGTVGAACSYDSICTLKMPLGSQCLANSGGARGRGSCAPADKPSSFHSVMHHQFARFARQQTPTFWQS